MSEAAAARIAALEAELQRVCSSLDAESKGRVAAERALRSRVLEDTGNIGYIKPIGSISTCFPQKFGTPRQGLLAEDTRGCITLDEKVIGAGALDGLEAYSHLWVITIFHENTNMHKLAGPRKFKSYIKPPQGGGLRVGLFATRSPHRPNPIALSLVKVDRIDAHRVHVRGVDLVNNTPVLDLKPFVPHIDFPPEGNGSGKVASPAWVINPRFDRVHVCFTDEAQAALEAFVRAGSLEWYAPGELERVKAALVQVVSLDPRGVIHGRGMYVKASAESGGKDAEKRHLHKSNFTLMFDRLTLQFRPAEDGQRTIEIHTVSCAAAPPDPSS